VCSRNLEITAQIQIERYPVKESNHVAKKRVHVLRADILFNFLTADNLTLRGSFPTTQSSVRHPAVALTNAQRPTNQKAN
jgi:hypothetical protein